MKFRMTADTEKQQQASGCLICDARVGTSARGSCNIFVAHSIANKQVSLSLGSVLGFSLEKELVHSEVICKKCFKLVNDIDELEDRLSTLKLEVNHKYNQTKQSHESQSEAADVEDSAGEFLEEGDGLWQPNKPHAHKKGTPQKAKPDIQEPDTNDETEDPTDLKDEVDYTDDPNDGPVTENENSNDETMREMTSDEANVEQDEAGEENKAQELDKCVNKDDDNNFICMLCDVKFEKVKDVCDHLKEFHKMRLFVCEACGEEFTKKRELVEHLEDHLAVDSNTLQCCNCSKVFETLKQLRDHLKTHYNKNFVCDECGKRYNSRRLLEEHKNTHRGVRPYKCKVCLKDFASRYCWKVHAKIHDVRPRPFACGSCAKTFLSLQHLIQHERTHTGQKDFVCESCGKAFGTSRNLEVHSIIHSGFKPHACKICGKAFARRAEIADHERTHTGEKPFQCELCGATFSQRSNLHSHKRATHFDDKRFKCSDCGKGFKRRRLLDYHRASVHTGERPYQCNLCNASFVYPEHYKKHIRIHTGEKPYKCDVCGKSFNSRDNRNAHLFVHSDKKLYECMVCGQGFMRKPLLYNHMETQGHFHDAIVVNQPHIPTSQTSDPLDDITSCVEAGAGQTIGREDMVELGDGSTAKVFLTDGKTFSRFTGKERSEIIATDGEHLVIEGPVHFADASEVTGIEEGLGENTLVAASTSADSVTRSAVLVPTATGFQTKHEPLQVVQIRLPQQGVGNRTWLNYISNS